MIALRIYRYGGGAALSVYEYEKTIKKLGYDTLLCGDSKGNEHEVNSVLNSYIEQGVQIFNITSIHSMYAKRNYIKMIKGVYLLYRVLERNDVNVFFTTCIEDTYFVNANKRLRHILSVAIIAGGTANYPPQMRKLLPENNYICFSIENIHKLQRENYKIENIWQISNRLNVSADYDYINHYSLDCNDIINLVVTSRIDKSKEKSILLAIDIVKHLWNNGINLRLDILGDGDAYDDIKELADSFNKEVGKSIISMCGYIREVTAYYQRAHICFGKGRSVIEPLMMNRVGVIIGDNNNFKICDINSFNNLYYYNFSGRNIDKPDKYSAIYDIIVEMKNGTFKHRDFHACCDLVRKNYDSIYLSEKINSVLTSLGVERKINKIKTEARILSLYKAFKNTVLYILKFVVLKYTRD